MDLNKIGIKNINTYIELEKIKFSESYENADKSITKFIPLSDFSLLETSWVGSYGHIILARHDLTSELKTIKMVGKQTVSEYWDYVETDKNIMAAISTFPFTVKLEGLAQDDQWLYMIMPIVSVNTLFEVLTDKGSLNETTARFFFAQIVLAVEFLHALGLVYRNFKPENVLITINGYLQLSDFSLSKRIGRGRTYTLCGTPDYMAPELIAFTGYSRAVDFWSSGVMLYEMVAGHLPFAGRNLNDLFENIAYSKYIICESFSPPLQDLITKIVQLDLTRRLGNLKNGIQDIKNHPWFRAINWLQLINQKMETPYKPCITFKANSRERKLFWKNENEFFDF